MRLLPPMTKIMKIKPLAQACAFILATGALVGVSSTAIAAPTPANTIIKNKVIVTYQDASGKEFTDESNEIEISIREVRTATLTVGNGERQSVLTSVKQVKSVHTLTNTGNVDDTYKLVAMNAVDDDLDATMSIYLDKDGNGELSEEEKTAGPISEIKLNMTESASFIVVTDLPTTEAGQTLHIMLNVTNSKGGIEGTTNDVVITFKDVDDNITDAVTMANGKGSSCNAYAWIRQSETWENANKNASSWIYKGQRGHLVTIQTAEENAFVTEISKTLSGGWWMGAQRTLTTTQFTDKWVTGETFDYTNWSLNEPNNDSENGLIIFANGKWNDENGSSHYIVEFELGACPDVPTPEVSVTLKAAKSDCKTGELIAGQTFGEARIEDMASGECVTMHMRAENAKDVVAKSVGFRQAIPEYATYIANSISVCREETCTLTPRSDSVDLKEGKGDWAHYNPNSDTVVIGYADGGEFAQMEKGVVHAEYRLKID